MWKLRLGKDENMQVDWKAKPSISVAVIQLIARASHFFFGGKESERVDSDPI